jgi:hypothetical protein
LISLLVLDSQVVVVPLCSLKWSRQGSGEIGVLKSKRFHPQRSIRCREGAISKVDKLFRLAFPRLQVMIDGDFLGDGGSGFEAVMLAFKPLNCEWRRKVSASSRVSIPSGACMHAGPTINQ